MAAVTKTGTKAAAGVPLPGTGAAGNLKVAYGTITIEADTEDGDIFKVCKVPANSTVVGGMIYSGDGDTGIEALDIDIGWAANGVDAADPDGFGDLGVWTGDATDGASIEPVNVIAFAGVLASTGPQTFTAETTIQLETNTAATTGAAMECTVVVYYLHNA
jgi:hypothetical protein